MFFPLPVARKREIQKGDKLTDTYQGLNEYTKANITFPP
jgi:hypothetical protein